MGAWPVSGDVIEADGVVVDCAHQKYKVDVIIADRTHRILAVRAGKLRQYRIMCVAGDRVRVEISPYDLAKGRITYRYKPNELSRTD
jgi:translation initiation factor IF-1